MQIKICIGDYIHENRDSHSRQKAYLDLLLLADEQEDMIDKYLDRGEMFILYDDIVKAECVVTKDEEGIYELKNIAVLPAFQRQGYGKCLIEYVFSYKIEFKSSGRSERSRCSIMML